MKTKFPITVIAIILIAGLIGGCGGGGGKKIGGSTTPGKIVITPNYTANLNALTVAEKYANAYKIMGKDLLTYTLPNSSAKLLTYDAGIIAETGANSITFTNTTTTGNLYVQIGYDNGKGCFDFTAVQGTTGKIAIDFHVDVDGRGGGGTYFRAYNQPVTNDTEEANRKLPEIVVKNNVVLSDQILNTYTNNPVDKVYFKITVPKGGMVRIYGIYLYMETEIKGFAGMAKLITGGSGAALDDIYNVTNAAELNTALTAIKAKPAGPSIININGTITYADWNAVTGSKYRYIDIGGSVSNLSIIGVGTNGVFDGIGLKIGGRNTIIKSLTIRHVLDGDGIQINGAKYTWVDHCEFYNEPTSVNLDKDKYDELLSAKNDAEYIIVSWCYFHDSWKTILVGSNDGADALPDRKMILHHNWFKDCNSRLPLYRGGHGHIYNNYYENIISTGINCRTGSKLLIENNYFKNSKDPIGFWFDDGNVTGLWDVKNNRFDNCTGNQPTNSTCTLKFESSYTYTLDSVDDVPTKVQAGAGVGK